VALTATLGFEGATEIELSDFGVVEVVVIADPQPVIDIKTKGRNKFNTAAQSIHVGLEKIF
jgi:hypothetical protein